MGKCHLFEKCGNINLNGMTLPHHPMVTLNVLKPASVRSFEMQTYLSTEIDNKNGIICIPGNTQRAIPDTERLTFSTFFALL